MSCAQVIAAPETLRGTRVFCPACGAENQLTGAPGGARPPAGSLPALLPASRLAAERLEDASTVLLAFAYLTGILALVAGAVPATLGSWPLEWRLLALLAGALASAVLFVTLKYSSEAMRALADVARAATAMELRIERIAAVLEPREPADAARRAGPEVPVNEAPASAGGPRPGAASAP